MGKAEKYFKKHQCFGSGLIPRFAVIKLMESYHLSRINEKEDERLKVGTFLLQKVTRNDFNNSDNIVFITNELGEGTDVDISKVFEEAY